MKFLSKYGELGKDVGFVGRWLRLLFGIWALLYSISILLEVFAKASNPFLFYGETLAYFLLILGAYTTVDYFFGEKFFARANPWINTLILVVPAFLVLLWDVLIFPFTGVAIPKVLQLSLLIYVGISLILQWKTKYGGCEVVSIPGIIFGHKYKLIAYLYYQLTQQKKPL